MQVFAELPHSNLQPAAAKAAAAALGGKRHTEMCGATALDLSGNAIGDEAATLIAKVGASVSQTNR